MRRPGPAAAVPFVVAVLFAAACGSTGPGGSSTARTVAPPAAPASIAQLGDSLASGEGTLYGYTYAAASQTWTGGNLNATWPGPYPLCHDSPDSYGTLVAGHFSSAFAQFACTGATFTNGISAPRVENGVLGSTTYRPAEFGNWATQTDLNGSYDQADPDLALVTLGADDVQFAAIVESCVLNAYAASHGLASLECTAANPGSTVDRDLLGFRPTLQEHYVTLVQWIEARGKQAGKVPRVVFTTYPDPLPPAGTTCNDAELLSEQQIPYLSSLVGEMNGWLTDTIAGLNDPNVVVADVSSAYTDASGGSHTWCTNDPWAYGLSIYSLANPSSFESLAPFHPTPAGQRRIAELVEPVVAKLFAGS